jgi:hypothetical protein
MATDVTRTLIVKMSATVDNHAEVVDFLDQLSDAEVIEYKLSRLPKAGETWKDEDDNDNVVTAVDDDGEFVLGFGDETFDKKGSWCGDTVSRHHIVEFVADKKTTAKLSKKDTDIGIKVGEYWQDRAGRVYLIETINNTSEYPVASHDDSWTRAGNFSLMHEVHDTDLITRVKITPCCD